MCSMIFNGYMFLVLHLIIILEFLCWYSYKRLRYNSLYFISMYTYLVLCMIDY